MAYKKVPSAESLLDSSYDNIDFLEEEGKNSLFEI
jgi:hypothetical protein